MQMNLVVIFLINKIIIIIIIKKFQSVKGSFVVENPMLALEWEFFQPVLKSKKKVLQSSGTGSL